jgi:hypothetical protein
MVPMLAQSGGKEKPRARVELTRGSLSRKRPPLERTGECGGASGKRFGQASKSILKICPMLLTASLTERSRIQLIGAKKCPPGEAARGAGGRRRVYHSASQSASISVAQASVVVAMSCLHVMFNASRDSVVA